MRTKSFVLFLICVCTTTIVLIVLGSERPDSLQNIVTSTHLQIRNFQDNLRDAEEKKFVADEKYLKRLGFTTSPRVYPNSTWHNTSLPAVVTYVREGQHSHAIGLINSVSKVLTNHTILVYDLGLTNSGLQTLLNYCNNSHCQVISFDLDVFPSHIDEDRLHAFRPLIIQDALDKTGAVLFLECNQRLHKYATYSKLNALFERAFRFNNILAWPMKNAISSLTHPKMFDYFHTDADNFLFLPMVEIQRLIIVNSKKVHQEVMFPWVQCALTVDCIHPIGAQSGGCRFDKKPQYRYSGCHSYDVSALSIVLGLRNSFDETRYMLKNRQMLFSTLSLDKAAAELASLERNVTSETSLAMMLSSST